MPPPPLPVIVLVEDREEDIILFKRLLEKCPVRHSLLPFRDAMEAIKYLGRVASGRVDRPLACFLDITMPGYDGFEVLDAVRASEDLDRVAAIVFSTSDDRRDVLKSAAKGAQCYLVKYPTAAMLSSVLKAAKVFSAHRTSGEEDGFALRANLLPR
jgi:CheY-like chemotaxis protein